MKHFILIFFIGCVTLYPSLVAAIIKTNNATLNGDASGWTAANGSGTNTCNNSSSTSETNFSTFAYNSNLSGQTAFRAVGSATLGTANYRGMTHQQITIPGSGSVNVRGSFSYYGVETSLLGLSGGSNSSWIRLDIYNSANNTFVASLGCVSFSADTDWTNSSPVNVTLSAGTTYTVRATLRATVTGAILTRTVTLGIDNINLNVSPSSLSISQPTSTVDLSWATSTPGTGALGLHSTQPYEIGRKTSSGVTDSDIISTSNTNRYSDSSVVGNTTYWYAVFDKDTGGNRSPVSSEVSILTKPTSPQSPSTETIDETEILLSWNAPSGGTASYTVQRAPDVSGSAGTYSNLATGVTGTSYSDTGHSCGQKYWYRVMAVNTSGNSSYTTGVQGVTLYCISIVLNTDGSVNFGMMPKNSVKDSTVSGINDPEIISPVYGQVNLAVRASSFSHSSYSWIFGNTVGVNQAKFEYSNNGSSWNTFLTPGYYYTFKNNVATSTSLFLRLSTPTDSDSLGPYSSSITIQASRP